MTRRKQYHWDSMKVEQHPRPDGVVDMELDCVTCRTRLYVSDASIDAVLASLRHAGAAILVCYRCGQAQKIRWKVPRGRSRCD